MIPMITKDMERAIEILQQHNPVYALLAPTLEKTFPDTEVKTEFYTRLLEMGFCSWKLIAEEAGELAKQEVVAWESRRSPEGVLISSSCPAIVKMIEEEYPDLLQYVSRTYSPMFLSSSKIKNMVPNAKTVFIGPCFWKKEEKKRLEGQVENVDVALTFSEFQKVMQQMDIPIAWNASLHKKTEKEDDGLDQPGQIAICVKQKMEELEIVEQPQFVSVSGMHSCRQVLNAIRDGNYRNCYIECMACKNGCCSKGFGDEE